MLRKREKGRQLKIHLGRRDVAKFAGHSLNGFEVLQFYSEGGGGGVKCSRTPPGLNRVKLDTSLLRVVCFVP